MLKMDASVVTKIQCPIGIEWPIAENRLRALKDKPGECLRSDLFDALKIPGLKYYLEIYPNDNYENLSNETNLYIYLQYKDNLKIEADFAVKVEAANCFANLKHIYTSTFGLGLRLCTTEEFFDPDSGCIVGGQVVIKMDGLLTIEKEMLIKKKNESFHDYRDDLCLGLWYQEEDKNFAVIAGGKEIMVHKSVLATRSPVFARMFRSGMQEAKENKVHIKDFSFEIVEMGLKLCYHRSLVTESSMDKEMKLLQFFDKYDVKPFKDDLEADLINKISEATVCRLANAALFSNATKLEKKCTEYLRKRFGTKPIGDLDLLDKDYVFHLFTNSFRHISK